MIYEIHPDRLWIGNALDIRQPSDLFDLCIEVIVDVAMEESPRQIPRQIVYHRFPLVDAGENDANVLTQCFKCVLGLLRQQQKTCIACSAGMSRSPTIAALALAVYLDEEPEAVVSKIAQSKSLDINGLFWNQASSVISDLE